MNRRLPFKIRSVVLAVLSAMAIAAWGCNRGRDISSPPDPRQGAKAVAPQWFEDVTTSLGIDFVHDSGAKGEFSILEMNGAGAALFDYDNDGRLDIYLIQNGEVDAHAKNQLYHQEPDGRFKNVSDGSGLDLAGRGMGVAIGDVNNDGFVDVLVCEFGAVHLCLNNAGQGTFQEITKRAGIEHPYWALAAAFFDYDRDGWLDLVVANYVDLREIPNAIGEDGRRDYPGPTGFKSQITKLYHNLRIGNVATSGDVAIPNSSDSTAKFAPRKDFVRFEDVTTSAGLLNEPGPGMGVVGADFDGDGWPDILVADDAKPNRLFINQRDGTFKNEGTVRGIAYNAMGKAQANMGIAYGDVDGDGLYDVYIPHLSDQGNVLWKQGPAGAFRDTTVVAGLSASQWRGTGFGAVFADFTNRGAPDLAVVNGRIRRAATSGAAAAIVPELGPYWSAYGERNQLFANDGQGKFRDVSTANPSFCENPRVGRGLAVGDIDNDGGLDLLVSNCHGPAKIYRNVAPNRGHWLQVRAVEPKLGGRDAYGAKITVTVGGRRRVGWINPGYSYQCSNDPRVHFGLAEINTIEALDVEWPDGSKESFPVAAVDQLIVVRRGDGHAPTPDKNN